MATVRRWRSRLEIGGIAMLYIQARREKITAKTKRNNCLAKCQPDPGNPNCWMGELGPIEDGEWCEHCREADDYNKAYRAAANKSGGLLRRLENAVDSRKGME